MNPAKAFRKFSQACLNAPAGSSLNVGLVWIEQKGWRVLMNIHTSALHLGAGEARTLAGIYDSHHQSPQWRGNATGVEWVAGALRELADEAEKQNRAGVMPPEMLHCIPPAGHS